MNAPLIRLGIPACFGTFAASIATLPGAAALVSANALFDHKRRRFRRVGADLFRGVPVALDSAGFVAMVRYRGYPWALDQYVALAGSFPWDWWAAPDFCCEPQVAADRAEVLERVRATAAKLAWTNALAADQGVGPCLPVLQGWRPDDYVRCADLFGRFMTLPRLVGLGSMCRRHLAGPAGAVAIVERLDAMLPADVGFHLLGVKGAVAVALRGHPRLVSIDSQASEAHARREAVKRRRVDPAFTCDLAFRTAHMRRWFVDLSAELGRRPPRREAVQQALLLLGAA